MGPTDRP
ncbi:TPA_asm: UL8 uORF [Human alphaherpesvirus 1]|nr:TPA_asm: UL8 uORF [Human alphaherpesvirus 1]